jgi:hypothetical protein
MRLQEPYQTRPLRFLELWTPGDWRLKLYGIAYRGETPRPALVEAARRVARDVLPQPAITDDRYGVGFVGVHDGRGANFVFVDWWAAENELHHHVFISPGDRPDALAPQTASDPIACVWDLAVLTFERTAWLETVLTNPAGPDLAAYLDRRCNQDV